MYVNIKILAAFPWFQALNVLVILTLSHRQRRGAAHREPRMLHRDKASEVPAPSALASASLSPGLQHPRPPRASGFNVCSKSPASQVAGHGTEGHWRWT